TLLGSILVLLLGGFLLLRQASNGVMEGKRQASLTEASNALARMQRQLQETDLHTSSLYERLNQLADDVGNQPGQFHVIIQGPVSRYLSPGIRATTVPDSLVEAVTTTASDDAGDMFVTPTTVRYIDESSDVPGLAIGGTLAAPGSTATYPVYFIFPADQEVETMQVLNQAAATTGAILLAALAGIAYLVSRQVARPVRQASLAAGRIASGHLDERLVVRGTDDIASLGTSMNNMASELQTQISQLEDLSLVQQRFVSDVSHELRTPLTTVRMAAELLHDSRDDFLPATARASELLVNQLDRFELLLGDLLEISRFDAGAAILSLDQIDVARVVAEEVEANQSVARRHATTLIFRSAGPAIAQVDARRVQRIVRNLVTNAIEHGEGKPVEVRVAANDQTVAVAVRDHGVGFEPEQAEQVFHRFWRADPSRHRTIGGTGLGLAISLEDARLHNGSLTAWGRPHQGALFRLTLPRSAHGDPGAGGESGSHEDSSGSPLPAEPSDRGSA
ncbi:MAG TPA: MtrAB system histidine kinase MtrB, partial [Propionibacteriaceae bacterium]|nr:MtrAB system histidine kinase MtrB [Propionibacteriaceae bacterium]